MTLAALSFAAVSCVDEPTPFEPGEPDVTGCYGVYFPKQEATAGSHTLTPADPTSVDIEVKRANASGAITVPYTFVSEEQIYTAGEISFADGNETTYLHVDFAAANPGAPHKFSVIIDDPQYASKYLDSAVAVDYSFMIVEWVKFVGPEAKDGDLGHIYQISWEEDYDTEMYYYETSYANIRFCKLVDAWHGNVETVDYEFYWNTSTNNLYVPHQWIGYDLADGRSVYTGAAADFYDKYNGWGEVVPSDDYFTWAPAWIAKNGFFQPYYDGNGNFYLGDWLYLCQGGIPTGSGYQFGADDESGADLFMAPGFIRTDYSLEVESDYTVDGVLPLYFTAGYDVASVKYAFFPGSLTATQAANKIAAVIDGSEEAVEIVLDPADRDEDGSYYFAEGVELPETGAYTWVAVSFDAEGNACDSVSGEAYYVTAEETEDNLVEVTLDVEDTPERYQGFHSYDSFAYYVYGNNLTDVHIAIGDASKITDATLEAIKTDSKYAVSEDILDKINGVGGYYTVASNLKANTTYAVIIWATNGSLDTMDYALYQTDRLPYVWNSLGKGLFVDDVIAPAYSMDPITVPCDIYEEQNTPGLYMFSGFQCALTAEIFEVTEEEMADYEGGNWENAQIIIDATDPNKVFIEEQPMGVLLSSSDGWISLTSINGGKHFSEGTLADGAITFPTKGLLMAFSNIPGSLYYANTNGMFKVALPEAAAASKASARPANGNKYQVKFCAEFAKSVDTVYEREVSGVEFTSSPIAPKAKSSEKPAEIKLVK